MLLLLSVLLGAAPDAGTALRLRAAGDVMLGTEDPAGFLPPDDGAHMLEAVKATLADADLTFVNLEGPLCDSGKTSKCRRTGTCYAFRCPTRYGAYLKEAGIDLASTANNHSGDFGEECRRQTEKTLDALDIGWSGPPGTVAHVERNGLKVALVAFHTSSSCNDVNNLPAAKALVKQAKAAADLVVVSFHGGAEGTGATHVVEGAEKYLGENRGDLRAFTHGVIEAGADLVLGHGPHVVRGLERYRDRLIVYSMGNFATYGRFNLAGLQAVGVIVEVELARDGTFLRGRLLPTLQADKGVPALDPKGKAIEAMRGLTRADFPVSGLAIGADGLISVVP